MAKVKRAALGAAPALFLLDAVFAALAFPLAAGAAGWPPLPEMVFGTAVFLVLLYGLGLYRRDALLETRRSLGRTVFAAVLAGLACSVALALFHPWRPGGGTEIGAGALFTAAVVGFSGAGWLSRILVAVLRRKGAFRRRVLVIGAGHRAFDLVLLLRREGRTLGYDIAFIHTPSMGKVDRRLAADPDCHILPENGDFLAAARAFGAEQIVVAPDERRGLPMQALLDCRIASYPVQEYLWFLEKEIRRIDVKRLELGWLLYSDGFTFGPLDRWLKRSLDVAVSGAVLLLADPLLLLAGLAVWLDDRGPVLYRQDRVTKGGRVFRILKLRTMRVDAEQAGAVWAAARDTRITRIGLFLRRSRLDELPQLFNVLRGDMSLVGPRPERPEFTKSLAEALPLYGERHVVRAGLTGWAQVNYPYGASLDDARSKLSYDLYYVKNFSVVFDMLIILQTLRVLLFPGAGAVR